MPETTLQLSGLITHFQPPIVHASGIADARVWDTVHFERGGYGQIIGLGEEYATITLLTSHVPRIGDTVTATAQPITMRLCPCLFGSIITPMGKYLSRATTCSHNEECEHRTLDSHPPDIEHRGETTGSLKTGVALVDLLVPIAQGQRELVVGDRKTGKTTFALQVAVSWAREGKPVIIALIGKQMSEIKRIHDFCQTQGIGDKVIIVATTPSDPIGLSVLTPFAAMTIAEYIRDQEQDPLLILDDLSTHAKIFREQSLLARHFPGRDSYPGDMFYIHARLLERSGSFKLENGSLHSITTLPIAETHESELTSFVVSNLISITDGHVFFQTDLFSQGMRPAINSSLSVTRVGKQTLTPLERELTFALGLLMTTYTKTRQLARFGAELTEQTAALIRKGDNLMEFFSQQSSVLYPGAVETCVATLLINDLLPDITVGEIDCLAAGLLADYKASKKRLPWKEFSQETSLASYVARIDANAETIHSLCKA